MLRSCRETLEVAWGQPQLSRLEVAADDQCLLRLRMRMAGVDRARRQRNEQHPSSRHPCWGFKRVHWLTARRATLDLAADSLDIDGKPG